MSCYLIHNIQLEVDILTGEVNLIGEEIWLNFGRKSIHMRCSYDVDYASQTCSLPSGNILFLSNNGFVFIYLLA